MDLGQESGSKLGTLRYLVICVSQNMKLFLGNLYMYVMKTRDGIVVSEKENIFFIELKENIRDKINRKVYK